jgi:rRNA processing protein Gar1
MNKWAAHIKKFSRKHPGLSGKKLFVAAKKTYKKKAAGKRKTRKAHRSRRH